MYAGPGFRGTWFIGKEIVRQSVEAGHDVTLFNRGMTATDGAVRTLRGDIAKVLDHRDAIRAVRPDVIVHCLCNSEQNARDVDALFADTGAHLIVLSSQDCYDAFQQLVRDRDTHETETVGRIYNLGETSVRTQRRKRRDAVTSEIYQPWRQRWSHVIVPPQIKLCSLPSEQLQTPRVSEGLPVHPGSGLSTQPQVLPGHRSVGWQRRPVEQSTGR